MSESYRTNHTDIRKLDKNVIYKIISNYDELLNNINNQVDFYKNEHEEIRSEISKILEENEKLGAEIKFISSQSENSQTISTENYRKISNCIIKNLQRQIQNLTEEKKSIEQCWEASQRTIENLEKALRELNSNYPQQPSLYEIRKEYLTAIQSLEANVAEAKEKLGEQQAINTKLMQLKNKQRREYEILNDKYMKLEDEQKLSIDNLQKTEALLADTKKRLNEMIKRKSEIEEYLIKSSAANREQTLREADAISKVQDALQVAESALKEKNEALLREKIVKEECDLLASTINQVMENAAKKVEEDIRLVKEDYNLKLKTIGATVDSLKTSLAAQTEKTKAAENKVKFLENELRNTSATNARLDADLHVASQTIIDMELKLEAFEKLMEREEATNKICEERAKELQEFLKHNRILKEKWKATVEDIAIKLQAEINQLKQENFILKNENVNLKLSRNNIGIK